jgi:hypothetical protein
MRARPYLTDTTSARQSGHTHWGGRVVQWSSHHLTGVENLRRTLPAMWMPLSSIQPTHDYVGKVRASIQPTHDYVGGRGKDD